MEYRANIYRSPLHNGTLPDGPLTPRQRALADAVRGCHSITDFAAASAAVTLQTVVARLTSGMHPHKAEAQIRTGLARARADLDQIEAVVAAYGGDYYCPHAYPVDMRAITGETRHEIITNLLRHLSTEGCVLVRAGDRTVIGNARQGYDLAPVAEAAQ